jgi:branched-chain amino acid transport system substrate-binding protein
MLLPGMRTWTLVGTLLGLVVPGYAQETLHIGQTVAMSGPLAEYGRSVTSGARAYFEMVNSGGGINGRQVILRTLDDGGDASRAATNTARLAEQGEVLAVFGGIEGGPCTASLKVAVENRIPLVACMSGSSELRTPLRRYVFPVRASHDSEFKRIVRMARTFGYKRVGFIRTDSENGRHHLADVREMMAEQNMDLTADLVIPVGKSPGTAVVLARAIVDQRLDLVFNHGSYALFADVIRETRRQGGSTVAFMAVNSGVAQIVKNLGPQAQGLVFTQVVPFPWDTVVPVVREYREAMTRFAPAEPISFSSLEGFISAKLLAEGLRRIHGEPSRERLVDALEQLGRIDLGGFPVSYSATEHAGSNFVDTVMTASDGHFVR